MQRDPWTTETAPLLSDLLKSLSLAEDISSHFKRRNWPLNADTIGEISWKPLWTESKCEDLGPVESHPLASAARIEHRGVSLAVLSATSQADIQWTHNPMDVEFMNSYKVYTTMIRYSSESLFGYESIAGDGVGRKDFKCLRVTRGKKTQNKDVAL